MRSLMRAHLCLGPELCPHYTLSCFLRKASRLQAGLHPLGLGLPAGISARATVAEASGKAAVRTQAELGTALSLGDQVLAVSVRFHDDQAAALEADWDRWKPAVRLVILHPQTRSITAPILDFLGSPAIRARRRYWFSSPKSNPASGGTASCKTSAASSSPTRWAGTAT